MERWINSRDLFARLGDEEILVLDCRSDEDWTCWDLQIPGALPMSYRELSEGAHVLPDDELIVVCGCASDGSDARKALRLLRLRGRQGIILEGGLRSWVSHGYPTERHFPLGERRAFDENSQDMSAKIG